MIDPKCDSCGEELKEFGAILLTPPLPTIRIVAATTVLKYHICVSCYEKKFIPLIHCRS